MVKLFATFFILVSMFFPSRVMAQSVNENYTKAEVTKIEQEGTMLIYDQKNPYQILNLKILEGDEKGKTIEMEYGKNSTLSKDMLLQKGEKVILLKTTGPKGVTYSIYDKYRLDNVLLVLLFFAILVVVTTRLRGVGSLIGLLTSLGVIVVFIIPYILKGYDPLLVSIIGSLVILFVSTYVAHGVSKQTTSALISTFFALFITAGTATLFTAFANLSGIGDEDVASLRLGATSIINLKGLFLGGIIIGTLGALNDVTIGQAATIFELAKTDKNIQFLELVKKGFSVGKEHILSLVNTLVLAYAGSSLFIFIFLVLNPGKVPYWVILNTETISGEIVSSVVGSTGLILAVPIVTLIASYVVLNLKSDISK